jgi:hypothetical protein
MKWIFLKKMRAKLEEIKMVFKGMAKRLNIKFLGEYLIWKYQMSCKVQYKFVKSMTILDN